MWLLASDHALDRKIDNDKNRHGQGVPPGNIPEKNLQFKKIIAPFPECTLVFVK